MHQQLAWMSEQDLRVLGAEKLDCGWSLLAEASGAADCPSCGTRSVSRHGWHCRCLQDLPVQGAPVALTLRVRRWRCRNPACERRTFVEQIGSVAPRLARRTSRVLTLVRALGHAAGGRPSERLLAHLVIPASASTVVRQLKRHAAARAPARPRVVAIDDWSWRSGTRYGTIIVDLERREVVDVLAERSAAATARWLEQHPEVEVVSRDRCGLYSQGVREGAPQAREVADRFHLLENLRRAIEQQMGLVSRFAGRSLLPAEHAAAPHGAMSTETVSARQRQRDERQALFERVQELREAGKTMTQIATITGVGWRTVTKWVRSGRLEERKTCTPRSSSPRAFHAVLSRLWADGCKQGRWLLSAIQRRGYTGSYSNLQRMLATWRRAEIDKEASTPPPAPESRAVDPATGWQISPVIAAALCMKPMAQLTPGQLDKVDALKAASSSFVVMRKLAMRFRGLLKERDTAKLDQWLKDARACGLSSIQRFARTLKRDLAAVRNAVSEPWSSGQAEGQINRLKALKRAMYGRACAELLRARMLPLCP